jgi:hypothetical protein
MSERGAKLFEAADRQVAGLLKLLSTRGEGALSLPCPGREELGDGTVSATTEHIARVYELLARFLSGQEHEPGLHSTRRRGEPLELSELLHELCAARTALEPLADLPDRELDAVPGNGSFRFCDGRRTLEQMIAKVLAHQQHHIDALNGAVA